MFKSFSGWFKNQKKISDFGSEISFCLMKIFLFSSKIKNFFSKSVYGKKLFLVANPLSIWISGIGKSQIRKNQFKKIFFEFQIFWPLKYRNSNLSKIVFWVSSLLIKKISGVKDGNLFLISFQYFFTKLKISGFSDNFFSIKIANNFHSENFQ